MYWSADCFKNKLLNIQLRLFSWVHKLNRRTQCWYWYLLTISRTIYTGILILTRARWHVYSLCNYNPLPQVTYTFIQFNILLVSSDSLIFSFCFVFLRERRQQTNIEVVIFMKRSMMLHVATCPARIRRGGRRSSAACILCSSSG